MKRDEKASIVDELNSKFAKAKIAIVTDYKGLTVPVFQEIRRELKKNNAELQVAKNTLLRLAVKGTDYEILEEHFKGTSALTVSYDDPVASTKALMDFAKSNPQLEVKGGVLEGKQLTADDLLALSKLPSRDILLSQLLSVMQAVPTGFVRALSGVPRNFVYLLQAVKDQKEQ